MVLKKWENGGKKRKWESCPKGFPHSLFILPGGFGKQKKSNEQIEEKQEGESIIPSLLLMVMAGERLH